MKTSNEIPDALNTTRPWMKSFGKLRGLSKETARINRLIEEEYRKLEPEDLQRSSTQMRSPLSRTGA